jgi:hypothetical protein
MADKKLFDPEHELNPDAYHAPDAQPTEDVVDGGELDAEPAKPTGKAVTTDLGQKDKADAKQ